MKVKLQLRFLPTLMLNCKHYNKFQPQINSSVTVHRYKCLHTTTVKSNCQQTPSMTMKIISSDTTNYVTPCLLSKFPPSYYSVRFYSNNKKETYLDQNKAIDIDSDGVGKEIHNDLWIKLLLDIKNDFKSGEHSNSTETDSTSSNSETEGKTNKNNISNDKLHSTASQIDEYDYRYADNDIEEFGYYNESDIITDIKPERVLPISLNRGKYGVFELEELTSLMEQLGADNIVSFPIPHETNYCDHMIIVTAKSRRHLQAMNDQMLWIHKRKKAKKDPTLHIEGLTSKSEWCAMDLGNLVLHIFMNEEKRQFYDIESLWTLGPENDPKCNEDYQKSFVLSPEDLFWMEVSDGKD